VNSAKAGARGMDAFLQFQVLSMNRFNQTEPATFSNFSCWGFFRDSVLLFLLYKSDELTKTQKHCNFINKCLTSVIIGDVMYKTKAVRSNTTATARARNNVHICFIFVGWHIVINVSTVIQTTYLEFKHTALIKL
jgi:hypothetical protein